MRKCGQDTTINKANSKQFSSANFIKFILLLYSIQDQFTTNTHILRQILLDHHTVGFPSYLAFSKTSVLSLTITLYIFDSWSVYCGTWNSHFLPLFSTWKLLFLFL